MLTKVVISFLLPWAAFLQFQNMPVAMAFPNGPYRDSCVDMKPRHQKAPGVGYNSSDPASMQYELKVLYGVTEIGGGEELTLLLRSKKDASHKDKFKGFMIRAFEVGTNQSQTVGHFHLRFNWHARTLHCGGGLDTAIVHNTNFRKGHLYLFWVAPHILETKQVEFVFTLVKDFSTFWVKQVCADTVTVKPTNMSADAVTPLPVANATAWWQLPLPYPVWTPEDEV